jgi:serine/threonine protein kinase
MGSGFASATVYVVDFGLSMPWRYADGSHRPFERNRQMLSTLEFASINCMVGVQVSRRDDMVSLAYTLIYLLRGSLPWISNQSHASRESLEARKRRILSEKLAWSAKDLCDGLPVQFAEFLEYAADLKFEEEPDYEKWIRVFDVLSV